MSLPQIDLAAILDQAEEHPKKKRKSAIAQIQARTTVAPDAPAPHLEEMIQELGAEPTQNAVEAWNAIVAGRPIIDVAHALGISIELCRHLIREVHAAIYEDLKSAVDLNRQIDLARIDQILMAFLPGAKMADPDAANIVLKALAHRAKLTGQEPDPGPSRTEPKNVMVWIQNQLPSINRIVDSLPIE
jgi:hypothetical protein